TGYFNMPETGAELTWSFRAVHPEKGAFEKTGVVKNVVNGKKYALNFRYSDDLPGYIGLELKIDDKTDNYNDLLIFSPAPVLEGAIFGAVQDYADAAMALAMKTVGEATVREAKIYQVGVDGDSDLLLWHWLCPASAGAEPTSTDQTNVVAVLSEDWKSLDVTLNPAFFSFPAGETELRFEILDSKMARTERKAVIRIQGIVPIVETDYDLWANSVTLRAVSLEGVPTFKLRLEGTDEWKVLSGISTGEYNYAATFTSDWLASKNAKNLDIYTPVENTGVWAGHTYEVCVEMGDRILFASFSTGDGDAIPNGDMENTGASCYGTSNSNASTVIWGSGNNTFTKSLCTAAKMSGMGGVNCSKLTATVTAGNPAAGNLFLGTFTMNGTMGTV
ncbi:MAG: DUF4493 domain-containing protein, partial [Alistipes sp.]|nr:DUF4493 domain-containing protein [Alistipes sp.]